MTIEKGWDLRSEPRVLGTHQKVGNPGPVQRSGLELLRDMPGRVELPKCRPQYFKPLARRVEVPEGRRPQIVGDGEQHHVRFFASG